MKEVKTLERSTKKSKFLSKEIDKYAENMNGYGWTQRKVPFDSKAYEENEIAPFTFSDTMLPCILQSTKHKSLATGQFQYLKFQT